MSRLEELLREASEPDDLWSLDASAIAHEGRRRVVRRRRTRLGVAAVALVVGGAAVAVPLLRGSDPDRVTDGPARGEYRDVVLSRAEMERRCTDELNARNGTDVRYVAGRAPDGSAVPSTGRPGYVETREGWAVQLIPEGDTWPKGMPLGTRPPSGNRIPPTAEQGHLGDATDVCYIPQSSQRVTAASGAVPSATNHGLILRACSQATGFDYSDWEVLSAVDTAAGPPAQRLDTLLFSANGHAAQCWLRDDGNNGAGMIPRRYLTSEGRPLFEPADLIPAARFSVVAPTGDHSFGIGVIAGLPDDWQIDLALGTTKIASITTNRGAFAYSLGAALGARDWHVHVRDSSGRLVWQGVLVTGHHRG